MMINLQQQSQQKLRYLIIVMDNKQLLIQLEGTVNLVSMMPPSRLKKNLVGLVKIAPEIEDNLYEKVLLPMEIEETESGQFLLTELNRDGDSYRSPITNVYYPKNDEEAYFPTEEFREFQQMGNLLFSEYTKLYYGNEGIGSFYVLESESNPNKFTCGYFAKKSIENTDEFEGQWNSYNIVDVQVKGQTASYSLETTVMVEMKITKESNGNADLSGFMKNNKKITKSLTNVKPDEVFGEHMATIGELIENLQTSIRQQMQAVYIAKTKEIIFTTRYEETREVEKNKYKLAQQLKSIRFNKE